MLFLRYALLLIIGFNVSFYEHSIQKVDGATLQFSSLQGKKVLIVNIAINSNDTVQLNKLEQLYQLHQDSLAIIAIPSNDFGNTPMDDVAVKNFINNHYNLHFILSKKMHVIAPHKSDLYRWLNDITLNGMMGSIVRKDYFKFLVNENGFLVGVFDNTVDPMSDTIESAIAQ